MEVLVIGLATAFNFIVILAKFKQERYIDALIDITIFIAISSMFTGTISGMSVGMVGSMVVSIWLYYNRFALPTGPNKQDLSWFIKEFKTRI